MTTAKSFKTAGMQNGTATLQNYWQYKLTYILTLLLYNSMILFSRIGMKNKQMFKKTQKYLYRNIYNNIVYNNPKCQMTQMSINRRK